MFKVRKVQIAGIGPFRRNNPQTFHFGPFFTLLRGQSGSGKTTVLQVLALLGHCNVMRLEAYEEETPDPIWQRYAAFSLLVGKCTLGEDKRLKRLTDLWQGLLGDQDSMEIRIWIRLPHDADNRDEALDSILGNELLLERCFILGKPPHIEFLQELVAFSRPKQKLSVEKARVQKIQAYLGQSVSTAPNNLAKEICEVIASAKPEYETPPRCALLGNAEVGLPPLVCYFNTDVHQAGIGLDIRKSPKRLTDDLAELLCRRLQVVDADGRIANEKDVRAFWSDVYNDPDSLRRESTLLIKIAAGKEAQIAIIDENLDDIVLDAGSPKAKKIIREFISSGENQILFLAIVLGSLRPAGSLLLLDEPDLHMSLPTAMKMYNRIYAKAISQDMQIITASHLSFVFPEFLHPPGILHSLPGYLAHYREARQSAEFGQQSRCVTLHWLSRNGDRVDVASQEDAAAMAGKFQNFSLDSILRQSRIPMEKARDAQVALKIPSLKFPSFGWKRKSQAEPVAPQEKPSEAPMEI
jgi:energy-coupling factor transporter ATP-binding protein EcfA2